MRLQTHSILLGAITGAVIILIVVALVGRCSHRRQKELRLPPESSRAPIMIHPENPHYFLWRGKAVVLVGASYLSYGAWTFDNYTQMLDVSHAYGLNVFRIFNPVSRWPEAKRNWRHFWLWPNRLYPWARSSIPGATGGGNKFDLDTWDAHYFKRLKALVSKANDREIVVEVTLMNGYGAPASPDVWPYSPLNQANNIQGVGPSDWMKFITLGDSALQARQRAVVAKVVQELNGFDNVYYEIMNEPDPVCDAAWHGMLIQTIKDAESGLPNKHLIAIDCPEGYDQIIPQPSIINSHYTYGTNWIGSFDLLDTMYDRNRILGADEMNAVPHNMDQHSGRVEAWEFLVGGGSVYDGLINGMSTFGPDRWNSASANSYRSYLGALQRFISSFDLIEMHQDKSVIQGGIPSGAFARSISEPGKQYAIYIHHSHRFPDPMDTYYGVDAGNYQEALLLSVPTGFYRSDWVDPASGKVVKSQAFSSTGSVTLNSPKYTLDIALRIKSITPPSTGQKGL